MAKTTVRKFRWFWAWQDEKEEVWLEEMSRKGYHLITVALPGIYTFAVGEPRRYVYRLDYQPYSKKDRDDYLQLFSDAGWEHIGGMSAWQYFRKEAGPGETPEIFTDVESKVAKYKRLLGYLFIFIVPIWTIFIINLTADNYYGWLTGIKIFMLIVGLLLIYTFIRIALRIRQLKRL
jgi:hypothetical protein